MTFSLPDFEQFPEFYSLNLKAPQLTLKFAAEVLSKPIL